MAYLFTQPREQALSTLGTPVSGAQAYFYDAGTVNARATYTTADLNVALSSPVIANSAGVFPAIYLDPALGAFKVDIKSPLTGVSLPGYPIDDVQVLPSDLDLGPIINAKTDAERTVGATVVDYFAQESTPERYATITDDTDAHTAFAQALAVNKAGGQMVRLRQRTYKINSGLVIDPLYHFLDLGGATLDFSGQTSGSHFSVDSSTPIADNVQTISPISRGIRNAQFLCNQNCTLFDISDADTSKAVCFLQFSNLAISNYSIGFRFGSGAFEICCDHITFFPPPGAVSTAVYIPSGGVNYGERIVFRDTGFQGCDIAINNEAPDCIVHVDNCSFDYCGSQMLRVRNGGSIIVNQCHFESNVNASGGNYWLDCSGQSSLIRIMNSIMLLTGSKTFHPVGYSNSDVGIGGIEILDTKVGLGPGVSYSRDYFIEGTGRAIQRNVTPYPTPGDAFIFSQYANSVWNSTVSDTDITEFTLAGTSVPARDATTGHSDSTSIKMNPGSGQTSALGITSDCRPGIAPTVGFYWKATNLDSAAANRADILIRYYRDAALTQLTGTAGGGTIETNTGTFTRFRLQAQAAAPKGTRFAYTTISLPAGNARTLWIDDIEMPFG